MEELHSYLPAVVEAKTITFCAVSSASVNYILESFPYEVVIVPIETLLCPFSRSAPKISEGQNRICTTFRVDTVVLTRRFKLLSLF